MLELMYLNCSGIRIAIQFEWNMKTAYEKKTYPDYLKLPEEKRYELIDGELLMVPAPLTVHQRVSLRLAEKLSEYVRKNNLGEIFYAPVDVVLSQHDVVQPDLLFIAEDRKQIITETNVQGAPDIVIEIISPASVDRDRFVKKALYLKHKTREYWLVDPDQGCIEVLSFENEEYRLLGIFADGDILNSPIFLSLDLDVRSIFKK